MSMREAMRRLVDYERPDGKPIPSALESEIRSAIFFIEFNRDICVDAFRHCRNVSDILLKIREFKHIKTELEVSA